MFGLLQPCRHVLDDDLREQWRAHLCGLCLSLRDGHGQAARLTTNTDAVMVSVLTAAQQASTATTTAAGPCPLRGMRSADVVAAQQPGVRLATAASLTLATAKARDTVAEQHHALARRSPLRTRAASTAARAFGSRAVHSGGVLDVGTVLATLDEQAPTERRATDLEALTAPTARACAEVFASSARLADAPSNVEPLSDIGADFGRLAHLLDAIDDRDDDAANGSFNPLAASGTGDDEALGRADLLAERIAERYRDLALHDDRLLRALLIDGVAQAVRRRRGTADRRAMSTAAAPYARRGTWPREQPPEWPERWPYPPPFPPNRHWYQRILPFAGVSCCGPALCTDHWNHCTDKYKAACCDCGDCGDGCCNGCCDCTC